MKCAVRQHFFRALALADIAVHNHQLFGLPLRVPHGAGGRFQDAPRTVLVAYPVFQPLPLPRGTRLVRRLQHALPVIGMNLLDRRGRLQFLRGVPEYVLVCRAVVNALSGAVHHRNHVRRVLGDQLKQLVALGHTAPHALQLQMLVESVNVKQQDHAGQSADPFLEVSPVRTFCLRV